MKTKNQPENRWFIWTIVFLLVSGVSLVSYIMITDINQNDLAGDSSAIVHEAKAPVKAVVTHKK